MRTRKLWILSMAVLLLVGCSVNYKSKTVKYYLGHKSEITSALKWCSTNGGYLGCRNAMRAYTIEHNPVAWTMRNVKTPVVTKANESLFYKDKALWNGYISYMNTLPEKDQIGYIKSMTNKDKNNLYLKWTFWCSDMLWIDNYTPQECVK